MTDEEIDRLLALAAAEAPAPSPHYLAATLAAALAEQPRPNAVNEGGPRATRRCPGKWRALLRGGVGVGAVAAGLAVVALLGGVIGYTDPGAVTGVLLAWPDPGLELVPAIEPFLAET